MGDEPPTSPLPSPRGGVSRPSRVRPTPRVPCSRACAGRSSPANAPAAGSSKLTLSRSRSPRLARKSSSGSSVTSPPAAERAVAPTARNAPCRSPRGASEPSPAQRFPPTVPCERISRSATLLAHGPIGGAIPVRSCTGVVAPIVTRDPSFVIPEIPARPSISAFDGLNRRYVMSGTTIVPPPTTTTSAPSPNAAIASSSEDGMRISVAASTAMLATAIYPTLLGREISLASLIRTRTGVERCCYTRTGGSHSSWPCPGSCVSLVNRCSTGTSGPGTLPSTSRATTRPCSMRAG